LSVVTVSSLCMVMIVTEHSEAPNQRNGVDAGWRVPGARWQRHWQHWQALAFMAAFGCEWPGATHRAR
jgi:hypothetical protein